jgi:NAD(P)-dependent dehydrogenase (short-subunit alcohol dehydrogenase family)
VTGFPGAHAGRVAVVTGGAAGLGRAFSERLASDGAKVVVADLQDGAETVSQITSEGGEAIAVLCDVSSPDAVADLKRETLERFGRCDILVNNAGAYPLVAWDDIDFAEWRRVFAINVDSMFLTCKAFASEMAERGFGRIVNVSSNTIDLVVPDFVHYISSKAAVVGLTRALATELGDRGVTVNAILPGFTMTPAREGIQSSGAAEAIAELQAIKRPSVPTDMEAAVSFFATEDARWITGQSIAVDGGRDRR